MNAATFVIPVGASALVALPVMEGGGPRPTQVARTRVHKKGGKTMKGLFALLALALGTMLATSPAEAKTPAEHYAECLVQTRAAQVHALLGAQTAEAASMPYDELANNDRCFSEAFPTGQFTPEETGVSMGLLRGRLAEQALLAQPAAFESLQPLPLQQKRYIRPWFVATSRPLAVDEMAACMADTDPAGIAALIHTVPGSDNENSAIGNLSPSLGKCLSAGTRLDASHEALRAALADALYQRVSNPALSLANTSTESRH